MGTFYQQSSEGSHLARPQLDWHQWLPPKLCHGRGVGQSQLYVFTTLALSQNLVSSVVDWYAVFFEACKDISPSRAGVDLFGFTFSSCLIAIVAGVAVKKTGNYTIPTYIGWVLMVAGVGLLTTLRADSSIAKSVGFQLVIGGGGGILYVISQFPILASIPVTQSAPAMALYVFSRTFGYVSSLPIYPRHSCRQIGDTLRRSGASPSVVQSCRTS
jgi:hypothetical protein